MKTLVMEIIPVVTKKYEFDDQDKSTILNIFEISGYRDYDERIKNIGVSIESSPIKVRLSVANLKEEIRPLILIVEK